jgi:myo-inositol-1(or 4)-monophosphatase
LFCVHMKHSGFESLLSLVTRDAGAILLKYYGRVKGVRQKGGLASVVCDADLAAEESILRRLQREFPEDGIVAEESGYRAGSSDYTWVIDPLDGTSNFVAGLPWFGTQIARLHHGVVCAAAMFLPLDNAMFISELGQGAFRNGQRLQVTAERNPKKILCAFGLDGTANVRRSRYQAEIARRVSQTVRNLRATNSLFDFCYTLEGRLGACVNLNTYIWDIAPVCLMFPEAGGEFTNLAGNPIRFVLGKKSPEVTYEVLGANRSLHGKLVEAIRR